YYLLNKYVYSDVADTVDGQVASQSIYFYYKKEIKQKDEVLKDIFISVTSGVNYEKPSDTISDFVVKIRALESLRQELKTDFVFYRLRHQIEKNNRKAYQDDPVLAGLKNYYRFGHEAATSHDDGILIPLQVELVNFGASLEDENAWKPFIEGLMLIHKIWLKEATGQPYLDDISKIDLGKIRKLTSSQKDILYALLETWRGMELVFTKDPDYSHAENIYTRSIEKLEGLNDESPLQWFKDTVISLAYRQRAYTRRIRGSFQDAIEDFQLALYYNRAIDYYHEEATLRNDLGFAQMLSGQFQSAFENMWDGLQLRYRIAIGARISLSHSSLAQHFIATGAYEEARKHARYAVKVAGAVNYRRGLGFSYLAFAEATRRFAFSSQGPSNQSEYLQQAQDAIEIAILLLEGERARIIDAKLEQACLYRDRVRIELESSKRQAWFEKADKLLREVAREADVAGIYYRLVDAVSNRVWLGYYANRIDYAEQAIHEFKVLDVIESYWLINGKFVDEVKSETNPILWSRIGKYYMGRGVIALGQWKKEKNENMLHYAARYMMLGMMYSVKFGPDHRGLREGRRTIYQVLADLNPDELKTFCNYVVSAETIEKIPQKPSALQVLLKDHALWFAN
ncbi:MAG: hypothetical protein KA318_07395, partial [Nitrosomonas sp.]|nr:hypothetical protein [Nitrosomonas sp.]